jgi:hypothetical protein
MNVNVFVESLRRLYRDGKIDADRVNELFQNGKITAEEKQLILNAR